MNSRKWADVDEEDDDIAIDVPRQQNLFETKPDENGIKTVIEYIERDGKSYKVTKRIKQTTITKWINPEMTARKSMKKFGRAATNSAEVEASHVHREENEVPIELCKKHAAVVVSNDAEDKFLEESIDICEKLFTVKKAWVDLNRDKQVSRETDVPEEKKAEAAPGAPAAAGDDKKPAYVPPSLRGKGDGKGGGKDMQQQQDASLRITNLSEDVREGDLQSLFGHYGRLQRVYLAKDQTTGASRGFAFVTYYDKTDAQRAIDKLHGHGYDNLILQVQWAKPKA